MHSARAFLSGIIDFAGLFPPAEMSMAEAVRCYSVYLAGSESDLLGRFVVPQARLPEFSDAARAVLPRGDARPWRLSVIAHGDGKPGEARDAIQEFNRAHASDSALGHALSDSVEMKVQSPSDVAGALEACGEIAGVFLEVPLAPDPAPVIAAMSGTHAAAKIRTGGVLPDSIPASPDVIRFMRSCHDHRVRFKATAGLHHAVRAEYPLTYADDAPSASMFGYLNVFLSAAFIAAGAGDDVARGLLEESDGRAFAFNDDGVKWRGHALSTAQLRQARESFAVSYGSCSFTEPVDEAKEFGLL